MLFLCDPKTSGSSSWTKVQKSSDINMNTSFEALELLELYVPEFIRSIKYVPWVFSLLGSALIGLSGILPLIIIPSVTTGKDKEIKNRKYHIIICETSNRR